MKPITFRVSPQEHKAIKAFCRKNGESDMAKFFRRICREQIPGVAECSRSGTRAASGEPKEL